MVSFLFMKATKSLEISEQILRLIKIYRGLARL